jgi:hypothetical protein
LNTMLVLSVNPDQFGKRLAEIYASNEWPNWEDFLNQCTVYVTNTERLRDLGKEVKEEGTVPAYLTCFGCGGKGHKQDSCPNATNPAKPEFPRNGREAKFPFRKDKEKPRFEPGNGKEKERERSAVSFKKKPPPSNKSKRRDKLVKKAYSYLVQLRDAGLIPDDDDLELDEADYHDRDDYDDQNRDGYDDDDDDFEGTPKIRVGMVRTFNPNEVIDLTGDEETAVDVRPVAFSEDKDTDDDSSADLENWDGDAGCDSPDDADPGGDAEDDEQMDGERSMNVMASDEDAEVIALRMSKRPMRNSLR